MCVQMLLFLEVMNWYDEMDEPGKKELLRAIIELKCENQVAKLDVV